MQLSGAEIMCRILAEEGVTTVFGYPGGAILPFYDALRQSPIQHILTAHEQGAAHAADGFARASGKVGVCIATSGQVPVQPTWSQAWQRHFWIPYRWWPLQVR